MGIRMVVLVVALFTACGGSQVQRYEPVEIDLESKAATYDLVLNTMRSKDLLLLEEDEAKGILSTQWQKFGDAHFNVQVLLSPVSAVVNIGCRIEKDMTLHACPERASYPKDLVRVAQELTAAINE